MESVSYSNSKLGINDITFLDSLKVIAIRHPYYSLFTSILSYIDSNVCEECIFHKNKTVCVIEEPNKWICEMVESLGWMTKDEDKEIYINMIPYSPKSLMESIYLWRKLQKS